MNDKIDGMEFWRELAAKLSGSADEANNNELGAALHTVCGLMGAEWAGFSEVARKSEANRAAMSIGVTLDHGMDPSELKARLSFSEKHGSTARIYVPEQDAVLTPFKVEVREEEEP